MKKEPTQTRKAVSFGKLTKGVDIIELNSITHEEHTHNPKMGTGSCKLCDCPGFSPSTTNRSCINRNSAGGTCNHWESEHN